MAAVCAICEQALITGQRFRIEGCEVMHAQCARSGLPTRTGRLLVDQANAIAGHLRAMRELGERLRTIEQQTESTRRENRTHERTIRDLRTQLATALRERDTARSEAALHQTIAAVPDAPPVAAPVAAPPAIPTASPNVSQATPAPAQDERDGSEIRFSLLELG